MDKSHKKLSESGSVEQNLAKDYVPKSKLGSLPMSESIDETLKKKMDATQKGIIKFKDELTKKYKFIEVVGIIPAQAAQKIEEEYEISEADTKRGLIHLLIVIPEKHFKNIGKIRLDAIDMAKKINDKFWAHIMTPVDIWNLGLDSKFDVMEAISMSYPVLDKNGLLGSLRVTQIHKSLVLRKFEKYVTSYVIGGSIVRGETTKTSDVDVFVIIDDTDVKRMPRLELKEKLRGIIYSYIQEAETMSGVKNKLSPQIYLMTDFWDAVKDAHPVMFTFIRDGIPLYDRGAFLPWKSLLRMGKIRPSPEAMDMFMSSGDKLKETVERRVFDIATLDLFYGIFTPTQGLLMLYGQAPKNHRETVKAFRETFVDKEKMIEKRYADILEEIVIEYFKGMEHGKLKPGDVSGAKLDELTKNSLDYIKRLKELREQIEKRVQEKSIEQVYDDVFGMLGALLKKSGEAAIIKAFDEKLVKEGKFPPKFLNSLRLISQTKKTVVKTCGETGKKKDRSLTAKQSRHVDNARKLGLEITNALVEYTQRKEIASFNKVRFLLKGRNSDAEILFLKETFITQGGKIQKISNGNVVDSTPEELEEQIDSQKGTGVKIDFKAMDVLKKMFGEFELIQ
ncbi:MAG: nucleotidyltransferase domain-containing protein [archaeon]|nr:nucleotidyltransferase domain-containing protein [archaeon]MCR4323608.1 nucleotidyltransferase domain-containing protein [Nanoarchaeota archaeon]